MVIEVSKSFEHAAPIAQERKYTDAELQELVLNLAKENGIDENALEVKDDGNLSMVGLCNMDLHRFMLKAEEKGLTMKLRKQTLIELY